MKAHDEERMKKLLRASVAPVGEDAEPARDLWPAMLRRLDAEPAATANGVVWFDWALLGGVVLLAACSPASIPVLLYYL